MWALPQQAILEHRPQPEERDALSAGNVKDAPNCSEVTTPSASASLWLKESLTSLKSKAGNVSSTMFTSLVSDKINLISKTTLPHKELTSEKNPS